jgi:hypothetical protein
MNGTPLENLKTSAALFCEAVVSAPGTHRVAIVAYGSTIKFQGFTELYNEMVAFLNNPVVSTGSTNIAGGLTKAKELVDTSSADVKNVLLMTDGIPNTGTSVTTGKYTSADHSSYRYANAVYNAAEALWSSCRLYTLGFFHSLTGSSLEFARRFFDDMENEGYWEVIDPAELHGDPQGFPPTAPLVLALSKKMRKAARVPPFLSRLPRQK